VRLDENCTVNLLFINKLKTELSIHKLASAGGLYRRLESVGRIAYLVLPLMKPQISVFRAFYGIAFIGYGIVQFIFKDIRNVFIPPWPAARVDAETPAYIIATLFIIAGIIILMNRRVKQTALAVGVVLLLLVLFWHLPYMLLIHPYKHHLGVWAELHKALALSGGAFVIAGSRDELQSRKAWVEKIIPFGGIFFSITMICFGIDHLLYTEGISTLVPSWIPGKMFWTYFTAIALICSGIAIILRFKLSVTAMLLGTMIFIWFLILHIPRAIADPVSNDGNEIASMFDSLAFSGIAFLIAFSSWSKRTIRN
jgi:uncharacterized membrane protein